MSKQTLIEGETEAVKKTFPINFTLYILVFVLLLTLGIIVLTQSINNKKISEGIMGVFVTDVNDRSAIVSWITTDPVKTELLFSNKELKTFSGRFGSKIGYDRRDLEEVGESEYRLNQRGKYYVHSVHLRELDPETQYYFAIRNGMFLASTEYVNTFSTIKEREQVDTPDVGYGNLYNQNEEMISDTLLIFELANLDDTSKSQKFSYVMDGKTGWSVNMSNLMNADLTEPYVMEPETYLNVLIINSAGQTEDSIYYNEVRPAKNISVYDNDSESEEVKGIMAVLQVPDLGDVTCSCQNCTVNCPGGYETSCPSGWNCSKETFTCTKKYRCSDGTETSCGTNSKSCYKKTSQKAPPANECNECIPVCPAGYTFTQCTGTGECLEAISTCKRIDHDGVQCGSSRGAKCFKEIPASQEEKKPPSFGNSRETCGYNTEDKRQYYWCECKNNSIFTACVSGMDLYNGYGSSCPKYCAAKEEEKGKEEETPEEKKCDLEKCTYGCKPGTTLCNRIGDTLRCFNDNLVSPNNSNTIIKECEYGCTAGSNICNSITNFLPQEPECSKITGKGQCNLVAGCTWESNKNKCRNEPSGPSCSTYKTLWSCSKQPHCEFDQGKCQEIDLTEYARRDETPDYCVGMRDSNGNIISISYGVDEIPTHRGSSRCSMDINAMGVNLGNQIAGYKLNSETHRGEWGEGYSCRTEVTQLGYGNSIIVTQPDGTEIRYAHLQYPSCDHVVTGNSGGYIDETTGNFTNWGYHLHVEVGCSGNECVCLEDQNPCRAIAGGCFQCDNTVQAQAVPAVVNPSAKSREKSTPLFSFMKKAGAEETGSIDPALLIKDLELPEGEYKIKSTGANSQTDFIKTNNNQILFFEDANGNNELDSDETILSPYEAQLTYGVSYERTADAFQLVLERGLNLVSFPVIFKNSEGKEIKKVSSLVEYLNTKGAQVTSVATYRGGKFISYVIREEQVFGEDFNLLPGEGYFINTRARGVFNYSGTKVKDGLQIQLYSGWNLVNLYNSKVDRYSAFDLLKQMQDQSVDANIISKWEEGAYDSVVSEDSGQYGIDFNVYQNRGYFVRVREKSGLFTPK